MSCLGGGLHAVAVRELNAFEPKLSAAPGWSNPSQAIGPPIFAGNLVWATHWNEHVSEGGGVLYGIDPADGPRCNSKNPSAHSSTSRRRARAEGGCSWPTTTR